MASRFFVDNRLFILTIKKVVRLSICTDMFFEYFLREKLDGVAITKLVVKSVNAMNTVLSGLHQDDLI